MHQVHRHGIERTEDLDVNSKVREALASEGCIIDYGEVISERVSQEDGTRKWLIRVGPGLDVVRGGGGGGGSTSAPPLLLSHSRLCGLWPPTARRPSLFQMGQKRSGGASCACHRRWDAHWRAASAILARSRWCATCRRHRLLPSLWWLGVH